MVGGQLGGSYSSTHAGSRGAAIAVHTQVVGGAAIAVHTQVVGGAAIAVHTGGRGAARGQL